ncbi:ABC transporter permease [Paenibacillus campi]|uniref:ABC transporter permease n=1 Tax=Paenibacillus campi TaxID=3106031 RepID=UPI002AFE3A05|nr:ABC transporter permease [Paenibacillus sp. SGZ-1014]
MIKLNYCTMNKAVLVNVYDIYNLIQRVGRSMTELYKKIWNYNKLALDLSKKDFKSRFVGSYLGVIWAFIQPVIQILIFWFVFQVGFKNTPVDNFPFILWLVAAMIPWFFFVDSAQGGSTAITDNSYLVKKVVFNVNVLPLMKIYSAFYVHLFFIVFLFTIFAVYGFYPDVYTLQVPYFMAATFLLALGLNWLTSALTVFLKDIGQFVTLILQFGFWLTPIFYRLETLPQKYQFIFKLNPMYYITDGYRNAFIYKQWFWEHPNLTINFWLVTCILLVVGRIVFKKLRPHFADVL